MANPRQRRKLRSGTHRPVSHSKRAQKNLKKTPPIKGPKALQEAWDKRKTVKQNYARLGLIHDLNPSAPGGSEQVLAPRCGEDGMAVDQAEQVAESSSSAKRLPPGRGRILRDALGNVVGVELPEEDEEEREEVAETMDDLEPEVDESVMDRWAGTLGQHNEAAGEKPGGLLEALEGIASRKHMDSTTLAVPQASTGPNKRHAASGEIAYLTRLTSKYGDDVEAMARDRKLNPEQRTAGQLRRALKNAAL